MDNANQHITKMNPLSYDECNDCSLLLKLHRPYTVTCRIKLHDFYANMGGTAKLKNTLAPIGNFLLSIGASFFIFII